MQRNASVKCRFDFMEDVVCVAAAELYNVVLRSISNILSIRYNQNNKGGQSTSQYNSFTAGLFYQTALVYISVYVMLSTLQMNIHMTIKTWRV